MTTVCFAALPLSAKENAKIQEKVTALRTALQLTDIQATKIQGLMMGPAREDEK